MKIIGISISIMVLSMAAYSCQNPSRETTNDPGAVNEPVQEERLSEPQVRDGMPEDALRDSIATDTAGAHSMQSDSL